MPLPSDMQQAKHAAKQVTKRVLVLGDRVFEPAGGVTVLIYHRVGGGSGSEVDLDVDAFRAQLEHLRDHHTVVSLDNAVALLTADHVQVGATEAAGVSPDGSSNGALVITFDDGTADFCDHVVPALVEYDLPATLYTATHFIDSGEPFPWDAPPASWAGLADAASTGLVTIGSHTHTHVLMDRADTATSDDINPDEVNPDEVNPGSSSPIADELDRSIELIAEHIGTPPAHFAYPKALPGSAAAEAEVRRRFTTAALARSRVNVPGHTDLHRLWRTPIQRSDGHDFFVAKAAGGLRLEGELRNLLAKLKYRGATN